MLEFARTGMAVLSASIALGAYFPYGRDIARGRVQPARAARIMLTLLIVLALVQQRSLGSGLALAITIGETIGSIAILSLAMKHGIGGLRKLDLICYGLLAIDVLIWLLTGSAVLALILTIVADSIAFWPTLHKTWHDASSETVSFFWLGALAPVLSLLAQNHLTYSVAVFPAYIAVANLLEVSLIYRLPQKIASL